MSRVIGAPAETGFDGKSLRNNDLGRSKPAGEWGRGNSQQSGYGRVEGGRCERRNCRRLTLRRTDTSDNRIETGSETNGVT